MIVFIDAYNVLRQGKSSKLVLEPQLQNFCLLVSHRAQTRGYRAIVVCDGGITARKTTLCSGSLTLHYAGQGKSADDLIIELCIQYREHERIMVSADRRLRIETERLGAITVAPNEFLAIVHAQELQPRVATTVQVKHSATPVSAEIDLLMQQASEQVIPFKDSPEESSARCRPSETISRIEKKRMRLLGKL